MYRTKKGKMVRANFPMPAPPSPPRPLQLSLPGANPHGIDPAAPLATAGNTSSQPVDLTGDNPPAAAPSTHPGVTNAAATATAVLQDEPASGVFSTAGSVDNNNNSNEEVRAPRTLPAPDQMSPPAHSSSPRLPTAFGALYLSRGSAPGGGLDGWTTEQDRMVHFGMRAWMAGQVVHECDGPDVPEQLQVSPMEREIVALPPMRCLEE
jgi:hypothetical protein